MQIIRNYFGKYKIRYEPSSKILYVDQKIPVKDFVELKVMAYKLSKLDIRDIRVNI